MRSVYERPADEAREIGRRIRQGADKNVSRKFGPVAKLLWPAKTAAHLAAIAKKDERSAARWLSGKSDPPNSVVLAVMHEIFGP
jgi:hypothetical protein